MRLTDYFKKQNPAIGLVVLAGLLVLGILFVIYLL